MKIFAIHDKEDKKDILIGYLFCYEKANAYVIELSDNLDEWQAPLLFQKFVREKIYTIPKTAAVMWVKERVIPSGRQNIGMILKAAKLKEYNELRLLELSKGKCAQDNCYLKEVSEEDIPKDIQRRRSQNVSECFWSEENTIICLFQDNLVRKLSLQEIAKEIEPLQHVLKSEELLQSVKVDIGGYGITFTDCIEIPVHILRDKKYEMPITAKDFENFVKNNILNTSQACEWMECTRQNIAYLISTGKLEAVRNGIKENLYMAGDIQRVIDE